MQDTGDSKAHRGTGAKPPDEVPMETEETGKKPSEKNEVAKKQHSSSKDPISSSKGPIPISCASEETKIAQGQGGSVSKSSRPEIDGPLKNLLQDIDQALKPTAQGSSPSVHTAAHGRHEATRT